MGYKKVLILSVAMSLVFMTIRNYGQISSTVLKVPQDYARIQDAITSASPGDTIQVSSGTYHEQLFIDKSLFLIGEDAGSTILDGNGGTNAVQANLTTVIIGGFTILNASNGVVLEHCYNSTIKENRIECFTRGIWLHYSNSNVVSDNYVSGSSWYGIVLCGGSSYNNLTGNTVENHFDGIDLTGTDNHIYHNNFVNNANETVMILSFPNSWNNTCEGNYWSDYNGTVFDNYGIGNTAYLIDGDNQDNYPLRSPYLIGDVNHDARVDMRDVSIVARLFGTKLGDEKWNPHADIDENGKIDMRDISIAASSFGEIWKNPM